MAQSKEQLEWRLGETIRAEAVEELRQIYKDRQNKPRTRLQALDKLIKINGQDISLSDNTSTSDTKLTIRIEEGDTSSATQDAEAGNTAP